MPTSYAAPYGDKYGVTDARAAPASAQGRATSAQVVRAPVCGMEIPPGEAAASAEVDQERHWLSNSFPAGSSHLPRQRERDIRDVVERERQSRHRPRRGGHK
jgi:hypothetical protein